GGQDRVRAPRGADAADARGPRAAARASGRAGARDRPCPRAGAQQSHEDLVKSAPVLGLDIGGSSSRARLSAGGRVLAEAEGPGANVAALAPDVAERRLTALLAELGAARPVTCCAGAAGAVVPEARARLEQLLQRLLPGCRVEVGPDTRVVPPAAGVRHGSALIAG